MKAAYPGSFDPITNGHLDVMERALNLFDRLVVAVFDSPTKNVLFTADERIELIRNSLSARAKGRIEVESFSGLLADYMKNKKIKFSIRGLRAMSDFDQEFQMAVVNKENYPEMETIFIPTDKKYFYLNSTLVKELARHGGLLDGIVPKCVAEKLKEKFR